MSGPSREMKSENEQGDLDASDGTSVGTIVSASRLGRRSGDGSKKGDKKGAGGKGRKRPVGQGMFLC